ncbi:GNAT family N-acetyltransferase [Glycomyces sp. YM15]|uniref:GNAT family N-acetyltransferase n=1 Tax=Glycomyces sp. YM15 TaxID=2800446 RepID=UPI001966444A|nr:GNAT family N-acetyltransferase [Glycomyces sp. YM15]
MGHSGADIIFERVRIDRIAEVLEVLDEAAAWLHARRITQWSPQFDPAWVQGAIARGETWLTTIEGVPAGTLTLDWDDPLWADADRSAGYVRRLATRRTAAGLGALMLDWAADSAQKNGAGFLRLDCVASNSRLRTYYESRGFVHRGDALVKTAPDQRLLLGPPIRVSRYELALQ